MGRGAGAEQARAINPFDALGVGPDATPDDVKKQYRRLAREQHSDVVPGASDRSFQILSEARSMLDTEDKIAHQRRLWGGPARRGTGPSKPRPAPRPRGEHAGRRAEARPAATTPQASPTAPVVPSSHPAPAPSAMPARPTVTYTRTGAASRQGTGPLVDVTA